jgi:hypothetical protein
MSKKHNDPLALCAKLASAIRDETNDSYWRGVGAGRTIERHWLKLAENEAAQLDYLQELNRRIAKLTQRLDALETAARTRHRPVINDNVLILPRDAPGAPYAAE